MRRIVICGLCRSTTFLFPHYLINGTIFEKERIIGHQIRVFEFPYNFCLKQFSLEEEMSEI
jgi:hypothetical protein